MHLNFQKVCNFLLQFRDFNNEEKLQHEVDEILRNDKEEIKAMLKEAKNSYKPQK